MPKKRSSNNKKGRNQFHDVPLIEQIPALPQILQEFINANGKQKDIPDMILNEYGIQVGIRSIQRIMNEHKIQTTRRNNLDPVDQGAAILAITEDDPLGRWGARLIKEKLAYRGIHMPRNFIARFRAANDPEGAASRHPMTRKRHHHSLHSSGPNEEWCVDGHEKILREMGIAIWGIIDKWARLELGLWAVPNARKAFLPPALYLRLVRTLGGIPVSNSSDKGSELGKFITLVTTLRQHYQPFLPDDILPAHVATKSVNNITRERGWRPIWEKELQNCLHFYKAGKMEAGFVIDDLIHEGISFWLWGEIVQAILDRIIIENQNHKVRSQAKSLLPTGGRRIDFYMNPEKWGGVDQMIAVDVDQIDELLEEYDKVEYTRFGTAEMVELCERLYSDIGYPTLSPKNGWAIWRLMVDQLQTVDNDRGEN